MSDLHWPCLFIDAFTISRDNLQTILPGTVAYDRYANFTASETVPDLELLTHSREEVPI